MMEENQELPEEGGDQAEVDPQSFFLAGNAEYFAQALMPLNEIFDNELEMNIVCEEEDYTILVGLKTLNEAGEVDVDCATLEANQESLRLCFSFLFEDIKKKGVILWD